MVTPTDKFPRVVVFVQARMGSTRLPGKVLKQISGTEVLSLQLKRINRAKTVHDVVVITTLRAEDDVLAEFCHQNGFTCFRGSELDLLDRHYQAAKAHEADFVVKIPSDSPLCDPEIIDSVVGIWLENQSGLDYVSNYHPPTFPDGLDVEGCTIIALEEAWRLATKPHEREHTFPYIWDNPDRFRLGNLVNPRGNMFISHRWTLDYEEDFRFISAIFDNFRDPISFKTDDILELLKIQPEISLINEKHKGINWYRNHEGELSTVKRYEYRKHIAELDTSISQSHLKKVSEIIPCCTQTLSKGYTQWSVGAAPLFLKEAKGCEVTDLDGNVYIDYGMALGPFILGYCDDDINRAVTEQLSKGTMFTLPHPLEYEAAKALVEVIPCAEMVRFGKNGSDATSAAVKLARAYTGRELVVSCGYHGWQDWYIASTERNAGVPNVMGSLIINTPYNDFSKLLEIVEQNLGKIACLIMEPVGAVPPKDGFLQQVRELTERHDIVLIYDELFTGFRWALGGASEYFGVVPDLACFGKAMSNGMPVSCVAGKKDIMEKFDDVFFSFTYGGETLSLAAIIATLKKLRERDVFAHISNLGSELRDRFAALMSKHQLDSALSIGGYPFKSVVGFQNGANHGALDLKALFQQECAKRGILFIGYHLVSFAHTKEHVDFTLDVYDEVLSIVAKAIAKDNVRSQLSGNPITQIFKNVGDRSVR